MNTRKTVIYAINDLNEIQKSQLLLYLLGDDWAALDVIDGGKWRFQEHVNWDRLARLGTLDETTDSSPGISEGEGLS